MTTHVSRGGDCIESPLPPQKSAGVLSPLKISTYRRIWTASLLTNFGMLVLGVGAAWLMTQLTGKPSMVALVQTALMLPLMLWAVPAGALADMYDRRIIALAGLCFSSASSAVLCFLAWHDFLTPTVLLIFCFLVGSGMAMYGPAWQSSVAEQVPAESLPQAIALNSISYNIARSFGPALGGFIVAIFGAIGAFFSITLLYIPLIFVLARWHRVQSPSRLPPERVDRAVVSGVRYIFHSPSIRIVLIRCFVVGMIGGSVLALLPLTARTLLNGGPEAYGFLLGSFGVGAVGGAILVPHTRKHFSGEAATRGCCIILGISMVGIGLSHSAILSAIFLLASGAMWMLNMALYNIGMQTSAPRWVAGRLLAAYQSTVNGGVAIGSWWWGAVAQQHTISIAMYVSGGLMLLSPLIGLRYRIPDPSTPVDEGLVAVEDPEITLALTPRSGPIIVEIEYRIAPHHARQFYQVMQKVQQVRQRNGAHAWCIARDVSDSSIWTERFRCPTWLDYLRMRGRSTQAERDTHAVAKRYHLGPAPIQVRRMLERPFGSVRWNEDALDAGVTDVLPLE
jgi:MFS family permease